MLGGVDFCRVCWGDGDRQAHSKVVEGGADTARHVVATPGLCKLRPAGSPSGRCLWGHLGQGFHGHSLTNVG